MRFLCDVGEVQKIKENISSAINGLTTKWNADGDKVKIGVLHLRKKLLIQIIILTFWIIIRNLLVNFWIRPYIEQKNVTKKGTLKSTTKP